MILRQKVVQTLFFLNALIWLSFGAYTFWGDPERYSVQTMMYVTGVMMLGNAIVMAFIGILPGRPGKWIYYFSIFILVLNILLMFTNQMGFFDLATLVIDLVILGLLISIRKRYLFTP